MWSLFCWVLIFIVVSVPLSLIVFYIDGDQIPAFAGKSVVGVVRDEFTLKQG